MTARVRIYAPNGVTERGILPTSGLSFSVEVGGGGGISFEALSTDMDAVDAWDSVAVVET